MEEAVEALLREEAPAGSQGQPRAAGGVQRAIHRAHLDLARRLGIASFASEVLEDAHAPSGLYATALAHAEAAVRAIPPDVRDIGSAYESLLERQETPHGAGARRGARTRRGVFYTPHDLIDRVCRAALTPMIEETLRAAGASRGANVEGLRAMRVLDPACGSGRFLVAAARMIGEAIARVSAAPGEPSEADLVAAMGDGARCVRGIDIDPFAVELCRMNLMLAASSESATLAEALRRQVRCADALEAPAASIFGDSALEAKGFDATLGNPPFLNQLGGATAHTRARAAALRARFGEALGGYADASGAFLLLALEATRPDGRVGLIQPLSVIAARDSSGVRDQSLREAALERLILSLTPQFDAGALTCAPILRRAGDPKANVVLEVASARAPWRGEVVHVAPARTTESLRAASTWSDLLADALGAPAMPLLPEGRGLLGDIANATADFRDEYYGLRGRIVDGVGGGPRLIATAMLGLATCVWGERSVRVHKQAWRAPRIDLAGLGDDARMLAWAAARLVPKVLLATQTRAIECWVDAAGDCLPLTPIITLTAREGADPWDIGACLASPVATLAAYRATAGSALSPNAIKLSAKQCLRLPIPEAGARRQCAAEAFRALSGVRTAAERGRAVLRFGEISIEAHACSPAQQEKILRWWLALHDPSRRRRRAAETVALLTGRP